MLENSPELAIVKAHPAYPELSEEVRTAIEQSLFAPPAVVQGDFISLGARWVPTFVKLQQKPPEIPNPDIRPGDLIGDRVLNRPLKLIPLVAWQSRVRWHPPNTPGAGGPPMCRSADGQTPSVANDWKATSCRTCPFAKRGAENKCKATINVAGLTQTFRKVYVFPFSGTSWKVGMNIWKQVREASAFFDYYFTIDTLKVSELGRTYFKYDIKDVGKTDERLFPTCTLVRDKVINYVRDVTRGQAEAADPDVTEPEAAGEETAPLTQEEASKVGLV